MRVIGYRSQRTLAAPTEMSGVGLITGTGFGSGSSRPPPNTGIVFRRTDLPRIARRRRHASREITEHESPHHARPRDHGRLTHRTRARRARRAPNR